MDAPPALGAAPVARPGLPVSPQRSPRFESRRAGREARRVLPATSRSDESETAAPSGSAAQEAVAAVAGAREGDGDGWFFTETGQKGWVSGAVAGEGKGALLVGNLESFLGFWKRMGVASSAEFTGNSGADGVKEETWSELAPGGSVGWSCVRPGDWQGDICHGVWRGVRAIGSRVGKEFVRLSPPE